MPNYIQNRITFEGKAEDIQEVMSAISGGEGEDYRKIDFNKILPMPEDLNIDSGTLGGDAQYLIFGTDDSKFFGRDLNAIHRHFNNLSEERVREAVDLGIKYHFNKIKYGFATWYEWAIKNWGTKWNAMETHDPRNTENTLYFSTAWSSPVGLIGLLSSKFPKVTMVLKYADEDASSNTGEVVFEAGERLSSTFPTNQSLLAWEYFFDLHPESKQYFHLVDGEYQSIED